MKHIKKIAQRVVANIVDMGDCTFTPLKGFRSVCRVCGEPMRKALARYCSTRCESRPEAAKDITDWEQFRRECGGEA